MHQAGRILLEDVPFAPLYMLAEFYGVQRNVSWRSVNPPTIDSFAGSTINHR